MLNGRQTTEEESRPTRRTMFTSALALGAAALVPVAAPGRAHADAGQVVFDCSAWGARPPSSPVRVISTPPLRIIVHHTATANVTDYSQARAFALARAIQTYHMDTHGWIDTGQHFTVSRGAYVTEGRHHSLAELRGGARHVSSAHCVGQNTVAIGIENEGTYSTVEPRIVQYAALVELCATVCLQYGLPSSEIYGHRDFNATACPGDRLYGLLPQLRRDVAARTGDDMREPLWNFDKNWNRDWGLGAGLSEYVPDDAIDLARRELE
ncbi:peptidoglycan recognition family protein [Streptomyces sp. NPDC051219]|uniref:peptidoglycan recognition protein family protein n=1 Tax=Streptomyces sp. NPDC051219 TaxID=3155283 RepID=UPI003420D8DB